MEITNEHLDIAKRISELLCFQYDNDSLYRFKRLRNIDFRFDNFDNPNELKEFYKSYNLIDQNKFVKILRTLDTKETTEMIKFLTK